MTAASQRRRVRPGHARGGRGRCRRGDRQPAARVVSALEFLVGPLMAELRPIRLLASVFVLLLLAAVGCSSQDLSPSEAAPAPAPVPAAAVDSTQVSAPPAEPLSPAESNAPEVAEETVASPAPVPEPVETVDSTPATSQPAQPPAPADPDAPDAAGATGVGPADLEGHWEGAISITGPTDLPFAVDMTASGDGLAGRSTSRACPGCRCRTLCSMRAASTSSWTHPRARHLGGEVRDGVIEGEFTQSGAVETFWLQPSRIPGRTAKVRRSAARWWSSPTATSSWPAS